jgi:hypothetical protein
VNLLGPTYRMDEATTAQYGRIVSHEASVIGSLLGAPLLTYESDESDDTDKTLMEAR